VMSDDYDHSQSACRSVIHPHSPASPSTSPASPLPYAMASPQPQCRPPSLRNIIDNTATFLTANGIGWSGIEIIPLSHPPRLPSQTDRLIPRDKVAISQEVKTTPPPPQSPQHELSILTPPQSPLTPPTTPPRSPFTPPTSPPLFAVVMDRGGKLKLRVFVTAVGNEELAQVRMQLQAQEWMMPWVVSVEFVLVCP